MLATTMEQGLSLLSQRRWRDHARKQYCKAQRDCACNDNVARLIALATTRLRGLERSYLRRQWGKVHCSSRNNDGEIARANTTSQDLSLLKQQSCKRLCSRHQCCKTKRDQACEDDVTRLSLQQQGCKDWRNRSGNKNV